MGRPKNVDTDKQETAKADFPYTPFVDSENLPKANINAKGEFVSYGKPHYAYRHNKDGRVELIALYRKPRGIVTKLVRVLKIKAGKNKDDAFFRLLKDNNIPEID